MKTAFIDTSVISECHRQGITASGLNNILKANNLIPVVGVYVTFEVAKNILTENPTKASHLFSFIRELKPEFSCCRDELYAKEADRLKHGTPVEYLLGASEKSIVHKKIDNYCGGKLGTFRGECIKSSFADLKKIREGIWRPSGGGEIKKKYRRNFGKFLVDCFENFAKDYSKIDEFRKLVFVATEGKIVLTDMDVIKFVQDMRSYPAFRCLIYNSLYLIFLTETHKTTPAEDRFTDGLIMVEGSYCSAIVSCDEPFMRTHAKNINPYMEAISFKSLWP